LRVILYEPKIKRTVMSLLDVYDIDQLIRENYEFETDVIPLKRKNLYRVVISSRDYYRSQVPCCWEVSEDGVRKELIVGKALFFRKRGNTYVSLSDKDITYITIRYRPYDFSVV